MESSPHILVVDNIDTAGSNIAFLLKLARFKVDVFSDELEACNWLLQMDPSVKSRQMLLLKQPRATRSLFSLLFQMRQKFVELEIMFVSPFPLSLSGMIAELNPPVHQCQSTQIYELTRQIFNKPHNQSIRKQVDNPLYSFESEQSENTLIKSGME